MFYMIGKKVIHIEGGSVSLDFLGNINKDEINLNFNYYKPNYMSFCPISLNRNIGGSGKKIFDMEPIWLLPNLKHNFIWENEKIGDQMEEGKK